MIREILLFAGLVVLSGILLVWNRRDQKRKERGKEIFRERFEEAMKKARE